MKNYFDKLGTIGTIFGAVAIAPACCLPLFASVSATLGLSIFAGYSELITYLVQLSALLAVFGAFSGFKQHQKWQPLAIATVSTLVILYVYNVALSQNLVFLGLFGLVAATVWNSIAGKSCKTCVSIDNNKIELQSTLTCPFCGYKETQTMPTDFCLYFYECPSCKTLLKPNAGDCCVFCSFGTVKCPPIQAGTCQC